MNVLYSYFRIVTKLIYHPLIIYTIVLVDIVFVGVFFFILNSVGCVLDEKCFYLLSIIITDSVSFYICYFLTMCRVV